MNENTPFGRCTVCKQWFCLYYDDLSDTFRTPGHKKGKKDCRGSHELASDLGLITPQALRQHAKHQTNSIGLIAK